MSSAPATGLSNQVSTGDPYRAVFEQAGDGIFIGNQEGEYLIDVNAAGHALLGYETGELCGRRIADLVASGQRSKLRGAISKIVAGTTLLEDFRLVRKDGTTFDGEVKAQRLPDGRLLGVVREVSERDEAQVRLRTSEALLRSVLETMPSTVLTVDRHGQILFINRLLPQHTAGEVVGASCYDFVPPVYRARVRQALDYVFSTGKTDEYELEGPGEFQEWGWWYVRVGPIVENDQVRAVTLCATNVTRLKQAEVARAELELQLRQAQKEEGIGRMAGGVAHDFNNLLTSILGFASLIEKSLPSGSPAAQFLAELVMSAQRGASLTQQLLAFARQRVVKPEIVDLNEVLRRMEPMLARLIGEDVRLVLRLSATGRVKVDVGSIEQVVLNLAVNARDAMPRGGTLTIETIDAEGAGGGRGAPKRLSVIIVLSDTGIGMTRDVLERMFEPFFTTKPVGEGTGLGLPMCQGIVKQAGGQISATSTPGQGTTFRIVLPRTLAKSQRKAEPSARDAVPRGTETLLVVEDDGSILRMASGTLGALGYRVLTARDGREALELFSAAHGRIDLVITDVVMPNMGGHELAEQLARRAPGIRVLFTSGYPEHTIARQGVLHEGIHFLQKPYAPAALAAKIRELLDAPREQ